MMRDRARLARLVNDPDRPVLFLFAGKAHPADHPGQQVLREIKQLMLTPEFIGHVVFLEDYDLQLARWLVTGVDVWLNNPVAPLEASGTSGIKAAVNGRLNLSVLDGWWAEGFAGITAGAFRAPMCRILTDATNWIRRPCSMRSRKRSYRCITRAMPRAIPRVGASLQARHDVGDSIFQHGPRGAGLCARHLLSAASQHRRLMQNGQEEVAALVDWKQRVRERWAGVHLRLLSEPPRELPRAGSLNLRIAASLNGLTPGT